MVIHYGDQKKLPQGKNGIMGGGGLCVYEYNPSVSEAHSDTPTGDATWCLRFALNFLTENNKTGKDRCWRWLKPSGRYMGKYRKYSVRFEYV